MRLAPDVARGEVTRDDVAAVLAALLAEPGTAGHALGLVAGDEPVEAAVRRVAGR